MQDAGGASLDRVEQRTREIGGERWLQALIGYDGELSLFTSAGDHALDEVTALAGSAVQTIETCRAHHERVATVSQHGVLSGQLRQRVNRPRRREVVLRIGVFTATVKHIVRREVHDGNPRTRELAHRAHVYPPGCVRLPLANIHVVEG